MFYYCIGKPDSRCYTAAFPQCAYCKGLEKQITIDRLAKDELLREQHYEQAERDIEGAVHKFRAIIYER